MDGLLSAVYKDCVILGHEGRISKFRFGSLARLGNVPPETSARLKVKPAAKVVRPLDSMYVISHSDLASSPLEAPSTRPLRRISSPSTLACCASFMQLLLTRRSTRSVATIAG